MCEIPPAVATTVTGAFEVGVVYTQFPDAVVTDTPSTLTGNVLPPVVTVNGWAAKTETQQSTAIR